MTVERQHRFNEVLAEQILDRMLAGEDLKAVCLSLKVPYRTLYNWVRENRHGFGDQLEQARQGQAMVMIDEMKAIADNCPLTDSAIKRATLQVRTRQWIYDRVMNKVVGTSEPKEDESAEVIRPADFLKAWQAKHGG